MSGRIERRQWYAGIAREERKGEGEKEGGALSFYHLFLPTRFS